MGCLDVQDMPHVLRNHIEGIMVIVLSASLVDRGWSFRISSVKHSNVAAFHDENLSFLSFTFPRVSKVVS
jgi:hypothetical protein